MTLNGHAIRVARAEAEGINEVGRIIPSIRVRERKSSLGLTVPVQAAAPASPRAAAEDPVFETAPTNPDPPAPQAAPNAAAPVSMEHWEESGETEIASGRRMAPPESSRPRRGIGVWIAALLTLFIFSFLYTQIFTFIILII